MSKEKEMTYEQALEKLSGIVSQMENGDASLDESLRLYEEGTRLAAYCSKKLDAAKQKVEEIAGAAEEESGI